MFTLRKRTLLFFCAVYQKINAVTVHKSSHLPFMYESIDSFAEAPVLSETEASSRYWRIQINERNRGKIVVTSYHGLYNFKLMPLELKDAYATFRIVIYVIVHLCTTRSPWLT